MKLLQGTTAALLALIVCHSGTIQGQETKKGTQVSGTVTLDGKPVTAGRVVFHGKGMRDTVMADISEDGKYTARNVKPADGVKVTIDVECVEALARQLTQRLMSLQERARLIKMAQKENAELDKQITEMKVRLKSIDQVRKRVVKVPKKYADAETTPLSVEVKDGEQSINLELKD